MNQEKLDKAHYSYCLETIELVKGISEHFLTLGERLSTIRQEELYKPGWESFPEFLEETHISESVASRLINIYLKFVIQYQIPKSKLLALSSWSDLSDLLPHAKTKEEALKLLQEVAPLRRADRRAYLKEKSTGVPQTVCKHPKKYTIQICPDCDWREKVYDKD